MFRAPPPPSSLTSPRPHAPPSHAQSIKEVLPKAGLVYSEKGNLVEVLCKPKLMPIKVRARVDLAQPERVLAKCARAQHPHAHRRPPPPPLPLQSETLLKIEAMEQEAAKLQQPAQGAGGR
jgi:hypothetical protein